MSIRIRKIPHLGTTGSMTFLYNLLINDCSKGYYFTLRVLLSKLLEFEDELILENVFLPLEGNCIGIKKSNDQEKADKTCPFYEVIFSSFSNIEIGYKFQICNDEFREVVGRIPFHLYSSFYFTINKGE